MLLMTQADARALPFRDECVQCVVTSPPYFGLRDYNTARWEGGDPACDHLGPPRMSDKTGLSHPELKPREQILAEPSRLVPTPYKHACGKCGATRIDQQIGLEPTIDAYVAQLVTVFREVWRVLKPDGVCWLNLGDSYAGGGGFAPDAPSNQPEAARLRKAPGAQKAGIRIAGNKNLSGLKPKDLCMIPARVALALQADGWWLRSEIVWSKPNPMPESVTDRPTKAHEMIYLLAKAPAYYFDADAVREPMSDTDGARARLEWRKKMAEIGIYRSQRDGTSSPGRNICHSERDGRNIRSVWHIATQPYPGAHFATMPEKLVERCILAGSRAGDVVIDPFAGSGTVPRVALRLGRKAIASDLNPAYLELADDRTRVTFGLPFGVDEATA